MSIKDRYVQLVNYFADGNKRLFSRKISVSPSVIENIIGSRQTNPSFEVLEKTLYAFENISADWLITGRGKMIQEKEKQSHSSDQNKYAIDVIRDLSAENALLKKKIEDFEKEKRVEARKYGNLAAEP